MMAEIYHIEGMSYATCSSVVKRVTRKLDGVEQNDVNLTINWMTITYDETKVNQGMIEDKVKWAGFAASLIHGDKEGKKQEEAEAVHQEELLHVVKRWSVVTVCFAVPLLHTSMGRTLPFMLPSPTSPDMNRNSLNLSTVQLVLTVSVLISGQRFYLMDIRVLFRGNPNMDSLVAIGTGNTLLYSLLMTFTVSPNPMSTHHPYYESVAVVVTLVMLGKYMESRSKGKISETIRKLMEPAPNTAVLYENGTEQEVETASVRRNQRLLIGPGSRIPLDGVVVGGTSNVDESMLTGKSIPVERQAGDTLTGGSIDYNGAMGLEVTKIGARTTPPRIIKLIKDVQGKRAPISRLADRVAGILVPIVMVIVLVAAPLWWASGGGELSFVLTILVAVLAITCSCALGLATPAVIVVGTGVGTSRGTLIKSGETLEPSYKANAIVLDKTGTITKRRPTMTDVVTMDAEYTENQLLHLVGNCEQTSEHPLGEAIVEAIRKKSKDLKQPETFSSITSAGIKAELDGQKIAIGSQKLLGGKKVSTGDVIKNRALSFANQGKTSTYVVVGGVLKGMICVTDTIKGTNMAAVDQMKSLGIEVYILTGGNRQAVEYIGRQAHINQVVTEILPEDKVNVVSRLQNKGKMVMMVGDGINDAPVLVQADMGAATGSGSDIMLESGDTVLIKSDLQDVYRTVELFKATIRDIK